MGGMGRAASATDVRFRQTHVPASLLLPMGRNGPAFLAFSNFKAYTEWNQSLVYATTAAYYADAARRRAGLSIRAGAKCPPTACRKRAACRSFWRGRATRSARSMALSAAQTRDAIRQAQIKFGLPADGYPSDELFAAPAQRLISSSVS